MKEQWYQHTDYPDMVALRVTKGYMKELIANYFTYQDYFADDDKACYSSSNNKLIFVRPHIADAVLSGETQEQFEIRVRSKLRWLSENSDYIFYRTPENIYIYAAKEINLISNKWNKIEKS